MKKTVELTRVPLKGGIMETEELREYLNGNASGVTVAMVAREAGLTPTTLYAFAEGRTKSMKEENYRKVLDAINALEKKSLPDGVEVFEIDMRSDTVKIPVFDIRSTLGVSRMADESLPIGYQAFMVDDLKSMAIDADAERLAVIEVSGDAMEPTLRPRDRVLVDRSINEIRGDGIYIIQVASALMIKRLSLDIGSGQILVQSDNSVYDTQRIDKGVEFTTLGQVVWISRAIV